MPLGPDPSTKINEYTFRLLPELCWCMSAKEFAWSICVAWIMKEHLVRNAIPSSPWAWKSLHLV